MDYIKIQCKKSITVIWIFFPAVNFSQSTGVLDYIHHLPLNLPIDAKLQYHTSKQTNSFNDILLTVL